MITKVNDGAWTIVKDIPINGGKSKIEKGHMINVVRNTVYMEGNPVSPDYQEDFKQLILRDTKHEYLRPYREVDWDVTMFPG